jgi:hypothetical protein
VSSYLVILSNCERNTWDLLSLLRPALHSDLRNRKESFWLGELKPWLAQLGLKVAGPIKHGDGDTDLLILDPSNRFGVVWQMKWLTPPDRVRDVAYTEKELGVGISQATKSLSWIRSNARSAAHHLGVSLSQVRDAEIKPIVLSKNTIGSGWVNDASVPISNERLLKWVMAAPHHKSLRTWWQVCQGRRYLPRRPRHFRDIDMDATFGGIRFIGKGFGMEYANAWEPSTDIDLTGIH